MEKIVVILLLLISFAYCLTSSNSTDEIPNDVTPAIMDVFLKILVVTGISIAGGGLVFLLPIAFYVGLMAIGFTGAGIAVGSCAAVCHASIGIVAAGSWFSRLQSIGASGCSTMYSGCCLYFFFFLWILISPVIGWFIWPLF